MSILSASSPEQIELCSSDDIDHYRTVTYVRSDIVDALRADLATAMAECEKLRAECGVRQIKGYRLGRAK